MAAIVYSTAQIGDAYAPSLNAAFTQIYQESGIKPIVLSPLGGERTLAQEKSVGGTAASDHVKKRAVDIDNQRQLRNWNQARFLAIMAFWGWRNVTEGGTPFTKEPWHFANQSSQPAGGGAVPINTEQKVLDMIGLVYADQGAPKSVGTAIWFFPDTQIGYYPNADEISAFQQQGGKFTNYNDAMWTATVGRLKIIDHRYPNQRPISI